jgi:phenylalanyl-tRNA synthetase beta chain
VKLPLQWLSELVQVPGSPESIAASLALRGFEVAAIEDRPHAVIDFEITANRPDCLSVIGLAREAAAAYALPLQLPDCAMPPAGTAPSGVEGPRTLDVQIEDPELCPRYCAQVFEVRAGVPAPRWMQARLEAAGVRSISAIVDVTNYVMLEMGQPTHAFDYAKLAGRALRIRRARTGEKIRTLDGVERAVDPEMLVIADGERPQAVGGVMGGADSEIGPDTKLMVLESAYFKPASIRRTSKRLGLKTEASSRFERGADVNAAPAAIARAAVLLHQIGAARPLGSTIDRYPSPREPITLTLRASRIEHVLGMAVDEEAVPRILEPLGFSIDDGGIGHRTWAVTVPSFRVDVQREIDLIEEIARHDGYVSLPAAFPVLRAPQAAPGARTVRDRLLRHLLTGAGLSEAQTFAFIEAAAAAPFAAAEHADIVAVANPLSEKFAVLRPSLLPGLIDAASHNRRREHTDIRLFETGTIFSTRGERHAIAGVWAGAGAAPHWSGATRPVDFFDVKGVVEMLARAFGVDVECRLAEVSYLVAGRAAEMFRVKAEATTAESVATGAESVASGFSRKIGVIGQVAPSIVDARGFPANDPLYAFELDVDRLASLRQSSGQAHAGDELRTESLPRFPSIVRDVSILVDAALPAAAVRGTIRSAAPSTLERLVEFDRYRGKGVPEGRLSLSLRLTFRSPERTLTDAEVDAAMEKIVAALASAHGAVRR